VSASCGTAGHSWRRAGGRERQLAEFDALFTAAGLHRVTVTPAGAFAVIEAQATI
jgi:hypothetical protein